MATATPVQPGSFFQPATRKQIRARIAIDGPSGSGKTFTMFRAAFGLAQRITTPVKTATGHRIAIISTEAGGVEKYKGDAPDGIPWEFDVGTLTNYAPTAYTERILLAGRMGYDILLIDSLSHAWSGVGGALELKDKAPGNKYTAWKDVTPMHNRMVEALLTTPCHLIVTMRSKTEFILEPDERGKQVPRKVGMAPIQRPGMEYEFDLYVSLDWSHTMQTEKSRCSAMDGAIAVKPGPSTFEPFFDWLVDGAAVDPSYYAVREEDLRTAIEVDKRYGTGKVAAKLRAEQMAANAAAQRASMQAAPAPGNGNSQPDGRARVIAKIKELCLQAYDTPAEAEGALREMGLWPLIPGNLVVPQKVRAIINDLEIRVRQRQAGEHTRADGQPDGRARVIAKIKDLCRQIFSTPAEAKAMLEGAGLWPLDGDTLTADKAKAVIGALEDRAAKNWKVLKQSAGDGDNEQKPTKKPAKTKAKSKRNPPGYSENVTRPGSSNSLQHAEIIRLVKELGMPDEVLERVVQGYGADTLCYLSHEQAGEFLSKLSAKASENSAPWNDPKNSPATSGP